MFRNILYRNNGMDRKRFMHKVYHSIVKQRKKDRKIKKYRNTQRKRREGEERKERRERKKGREIGGRKKDKLFDKRPAKGIMVHHTVESHSVLNKIYCTYGKIYY